MFWRYPRSCYETISRMRSVRPRGDRIRAPRKVGGGDPRVVAMDLHAAKLRPPASGGSAGPTCALAKLGGGSECARGFGRPRLGAPWISRAEGHKYRRVQFVAKIRPGRMLHAKVVRLLLLVAHSGQFATRVGERLSEVRPTEHPQPRSIYSIVGPPPMNDDRPPDYALPRFASARATCSSICATSAVASIADTSTLRTADAGPCVPYKWR
jgi:hypothetical protein